MAKLLSRVRETPRSSEIQGGFFFHLTFVIQLVSTIMYIKK